MAKFKIFVIRKSDFHNNFMVNVLYLTDAFFGWMREPGFVWVNCMTW